MVNLCARYERHTANTRLPFSRQVVPPLKNYAKES